MRLHPSLLLVLTAFLIGSPALAQWTFVHHFSSAPRTIFFFDDDSLPTTGLVGLDDGEVFRTSDAGRTWHSCYADTKGYSVSCFAFKDRLTGWMTTTFNWDGSHATGTGSPAIFKTTDGGYSWQYSGIDGSFNVVYYEPATGRLLASIGDWYFYNQSSPQQQVLYSDNDGRTWTSIVPYAYAGVAASSDGSRIMMSGGWDWNIQNYVYNKVLVTSDQWRTWKVIDFPSSNQYNEENFWQPAASVSSPGTYYAVGTWSHRFWKSTDQGNTWRQTYLFPFTSANHTWDYGPTACVRVDDCDDIYAQTSDAGFSVSMDGGISWRNVGGPDIGWATRFHVHGDRIYAASGDGDLFMSTSARLTHTLRIDTGLDFSTAQCEATTRTIQFSGTACKEPNDSLLGVTFSDPSHFITQGQFPTHFTTGDSLAISYLPAGEHSVTGRATLHFSFDGYQVDTTVTLRAQNGVTLKPVGPVVSVTASEVAPASTVSASLAFDGPIPASANLTDIDAAVSFDQDILTPVASAPQNGFTVVSAIQTGNSYRAKLHRRSATDLPAGSPVLLISFKGFVAKSDASTIRVSSLTLNGEDTITDNCTYALALDTANAATVFVASECGDGLIRAAMNRHLLIDAAAVVSSSDESAIHVHISLTSSAALQFEIFDLLGNEVATPANVSVQAGQSQVELPIALRSGTYFLVVKAGGERRTLRFSIDR